MQNIYIYIYIYIYVCVCVCVCVCAANVALYSKSDSYMETLYIAN